MEPASGSATPMTKLIINPRVLGKVVFVHPWHVPVGLGSVSMKMVWEVAAVCPEASATVRLAV